MRGVLKFFLTAFLAFACATLLWEALLRQTALKTPGSRFHEELGMILQKGVFMRGTEGRCVTRINSLGMPDQEIGEKRPEETRILMLGDSFTAAMQLPPEKSFSRVLEKLLAKRTGKPIRVINGGRDGATPAFYIHPARFFKNKIKPDYVVVEFYDSDFTLELMNPNTNFFIARSGAGFKSVFNRAFVSQSRLIQTRPKISFIFEYSTMNIGYYNLVKMYTKWRMERAASRSGARKSLTAMDPALVNWVVKRLASEYPHLVILFLPAIDYQGDMDNKSRTETLLGEATTRHGVPFVDMRKDFAAYYRARRQPPVGFNNTSPWKGHINEIGHRLTAQRLAGVLAGEITK